MGEARMTLLDHLAELRRRIIRALIVFLVCSFVCFGLFYDTAKDALTAPLDALDPNTTNPFAHRNPIVNRLRPFLVEGEGPESVELHHLTLMEPLIVKFKLGLLMGFVVSAPYLLFQAWAFIGAGLLPRERRAAYRYFPLSLLLFLIGVAFAYFLAAPAATLFLLSVDPEITPTLTYASHFRLMIVTVPAFGVAFQLPIVTMALATLGIVPAKSLAKYRRYAIVLMFLIGAILTPPEPFTQCLLAIPLVGLYELGVRMARAAERRAKGRDGA